MASRSLWTNFVGPPSVSATSSNFTLGPNFTPSVDGQVTHLLWYRGATGANNLPQRLSLWNRSSGTKIAEVVGFSDNGVVGWKSYALVTPAGLAAGVTYCVAADIPSGTNIVYVGNGSQPTPDTNLAWPANKRGIHTGAMNTFPETVDNTQVLLYDIVFDDAAGLPPSDEPASQADVEAVIASWFTLGVGNDHVGQLPNQTYEAITDTDTGLPKILTDIGNISADMLTSESAIIGTITDGLDNIDAALVNALGPAGNLVTGALRTYLNGLETTINNTLGLIEQVRGGVQGMAPGDDPGWTVVAGDDFTGPFLVPDKCDRILVAITDLGDANRLAVYAGISFLSFAWWWAPMFGDYVGSHRTSRALNADLHVPGRQLDGALVVVPADFTGTWQALRFDG